MIFVFARIVHLFCFGGLHCPAAAQGQEAKHARSKQGERTRLGNMVGRTRDEAQEIAGQSASGFGSSCGGGEDESGKAEEIGGEERQRGGLGHPYAP